MIELVWDKPFEKKFKKYISILIYYYLFPSFLSFK